MLHFFFHMRDNAHGGTLQLDQSAFEECNAQASFANLRDGGHIFYVSVNESSGAFVTSEFKWIVGKYNNILVQLMQLTLHSGY